MTKIDDLKPDYDHLDPVKIYLNLFSNINDDVVNFGTLVFKKDLGNYIVGDYNLPILFLFRRFLELQDSITVLIDYGKSTAIKLIMRSLLENYLYLEYLISQDSELPGLCFIYERTETKIKFYQKILSEEKFFEDSLASNDFQKDKKTIDEIEENLRSQLELLKSGKYADITIVKKALKKKNIHNPKWYTLSNPEIKSIFDLAKFLEKRDLYNIFYKFGSNTVHGSDCYEGNFILNPDNSIGVFDIRTPFDIQNIVKQNLTISLQTLQTYIDHRRPVMKNDFTKWYSEIYKPNLLKISNCNLTINRNDLNSLNDHLDL